MPSNFVRSRLIVLSFEQNLEKMRADYIFTSEGKQQRQDYRLFQAQVARLCFEGPSAPLRPIPCPTEGEYIREVCGVLGLEAYDAERVSTGCTPGLAFNHRPSTGGGGARSHTTTSSFVGAGGDVLLWYNIPGRSSKEPVMQHTTHDEDEREGMEEWDYLPRRSSSSSSGGAGAAAPPAPPGGTEHWRKSTYVLPESAPKDFIGSAVAVVDLGNRLQHVVKGVMLRFNAAHAALMKAWYALASVLALAPFREQMLCRDVALADERLQTELLAELQSVFQDAALQYEFLGSEDEGEKAPSKKKKQQQKAAASASAAAPPAALAPPAPAPAAPAAPATPAAAPAPPPPSPQGSPG
jgi:hypothetical protein